MMNKPIIKIPEKLIIMGKEFEVIQSRDIEGAEFSIWNKKITIGITMQRDVIVESLIHEISEIIHCILSHRLTKTENGSFIFLMDHANFQSHNEILFDTLIQNKLIKYII
jgi:hypothetical protein